jgi:DNA-binding phage protein
MLRLITAPLILLFLLTVFKLSAQQPQRDLSRAEYIEIYKPVAMQKMRDFGIPASITMAQAIVESASGNSMLARGANNHFGIKCHEWTGETFTWDDDEKNECFRKYVAAEESFHDHSLFLTRRPRYAGLFELEITDYRAWAHGLRSAGYATNPQYAHMLIRIIEENRLYELDHEALHGPVLADVVHESIDDHVYASAGYEEFGPGPNNRTLYLNNRRLFVFARPDDTYFKIANDFDMHLAKIHNINDVDNGIRLREGSLVFIELKRRRSATATHNVASHETMHDIAQRYGIRLKSLYRHNNMTEGSAPRPGQTLKLRP